MNSLKVILLIVQTAIYFQPGWSHKCFVCGPEGGKPEDLYQLKKSFPNMVVPSCSKYKQSNKDQYLIDCPPGLSNGCLTKFEGKFIFHNLDLQSTILGAYNDL